MAMLPQINRNPIYVNNDDICKEALEACQRKNDKGNQKDPPIFNTGATVAVQQEDWLPWTHGMIVEPNSNDHRIFLYDMTNEVW